MLLPTFFSQQELGKLTRINEFVYSAYRKHHPPSLDDETWRLEKIARDGASHKKLAAYGIETVKDFLRLYMRDTSTLRNVRERHHPCLNDKSSSVAYAIFSSILFVLLRKCLQIIGGISERNWNTIIRHAMDCVVDDNKLYAYHQAGQGVSLFLNSIYKVVGAMFDGHYCTVEELTPSQKVCTHFGLFLCNNHHNSIICCNWVEKAA